MKKKLLHFNNSDSGGGAEVFALDFLSLDAFESVLCVKKKRTNHSNVVSLKRSWLSYLLEFIDKVLFKLLKRKLFANLSVKYAIHGTWKQLQKIPFFR
ncbi:MAG: hypothetical protein RMJ89_10810, partial [Flammeovirgaceae bacterium]|nr:hypothetical protein [Flammeovirgaceae bacterium]